MSKSLKHYTIVLAALVLFSCKKKNDTEPEVNFSPLTTGSTWTYQSTSTAGGTNNYTLTATSRDTVVNSRTYRVLSNSQGGSSYRNKTGNEYWQYGSVAADIQLEQLYLKDNVSVNNTWQSSHPFTVPGLPPLTATMIYTIKEKGVTRTVNGTAFSNVIRVGLTVSIAGLGEVVDADMYHAAGVGIIETRYNVKNLALAGIPNSTTTEVLTNYSIK